MIYVLFFVFVIGYALLCEYMVRRGARQQDEATRKAKER